jgi:hypothetical protein
MPYMRNPLDMTDDDYEGALSDDEHEQVSEMLGMGGALSASVPRALVERVQWMYETDAHTFRLKLDSPAGREEEIGVFLYYVLERIAERAPGFSHYGPVHYRTPLGPPVDGPGGTIILGKAVLTPRQWSAEEMRSAGRRRMRTNACK